MSATTRSEYEEILKLVSAWSPRQQFMLIQDLLKIMAPASATERSPLSGAEIAQWLEEHRSRRGEQ